MVDETGSVSSTNQAAAQSQQVSDAAKPAAKEGSKEGGYTTATKIATMAELKEKAPEVHNETLKGIAMQIVSDMRRHADRLKKLMREASRNKG